MTYIAAEPETAQVFVDQTGNYHDTREDAIEANFESDLMKVCKDVVNTDKCSNVSINEAYWVIKQFTKRHPDMVRVMLGDRDAT